MLTPTPRLHSVSRRQGVTPPPACMQICDGAVFVHPFTCIHCRLHTGFAMPIRSAILCLLPIVFIVTTAVFLPCCSAFAPLFHPTSNPTRQSRHRVGKGMKPIPAPTPNILSRIEFSATHRTCVVTYPCIHEKEWLQHRPFRPRHFIWGRICKPHTLL